MGISQQCQKWRHIEISTALSGHVNSARRGVNKSFNPCLQPFNPLVLCKGCFLGSVWFGSEHFIKLTRLWGAVHGPPKHCTNSLTLLLHFNLACPCHWAMHKHAQDVAMARGTQSHTEDRKTHRHESWPCCQLVKRRSILAAVPPHCIGVHVWRGVAWVSCPTFKGRVKHDRVLAVQPCWPQGSTPNPKLREQASGDKQQDATSYCN